ncbi:hypothetical protein PVK06_009998 [Gossypium arboreum]|uniref:Uncharacterized protein n=1 Tax=Gossypium arboreum TaxID=29729 RepID=A0ABR0QP30_GOSAR|nr:hypothetical protein PVK06_009998 [Gossypium arboreum]
MQEVLEAGHELYSSEELGEKEYVLLIELRCHDCAGLVRNGAGEGTAAGGYLPVSLYRWLAICGDQLS